MAKYECSVCGFIYNEQSASLKFAELDSCPICGAAKDGFKMLEEDDNAFSGGRVVKLDEIGDMVADRTALDTLGNLAVETALGLRDGFQR